eukprot:TRINITY_DN89092_c0_g1_i1.p2 TRINITY_DN89092_c0_g1~~TRINITY_DN89092_c0_g1_i1.p2  ORF type:complete len:104 (-),score=15.56 TRINITY_DN89092_c0_g1_i1:65-331(-)
MEQGHGVTQLAKASSASALFARVIARQKGNAIPFVAGSPAVRMDENGVYAGDIKLCLANKLWMYYDNVIFLSVLMPAGFVWFMNRVPK